MLRHVGVNVRDLAQAKDYYDVLMPLLGFEAHIVAQDQFAYRPINDAPGASLFFYPALEQSPYSRHQPGLQHLAFMLDSRAAVHAAFFTLAGPWTRLAAERTWWSGADSVFT